MGPGDPRQQHHPGQLTRHARGASRPRRDQPTRITGFEAPTWVAFVGRAGTPEPILPKMGEAFTTALRMPEVRDKIEENGLDVVASGAERCRRFMIGEVEKWGRVICDNNISAES